MSDFDDGCLVRQCLDGDKAAFDVLVRRHGRKVRSVVVTLLGATADVDDFVQETFVRAYTSLPRFKGESAFATWLLRIAVNLCKNHCASAWQRKIVVSDELTTHDEPPDELLAALGEEASAESQWWAREQQANVRQAIDELPEHQRTVILLRFFEDMSYADIARVLRCPESTVRARVSAGLQRLGERLSPFFDLTPIIQQKQKTKQGESFAL